MKQIIVKALLWMKILKRTDFIYKSRINSFVLLFKEIKDVLVTNATKDLPPDKREPNLEGWRALFHASFENAPPDILKEIPSILKKHLPK